MPFLPGGSPRPQGGGWFKLPGSAKKTHPKEESVSEKLIRDLDELEPDVKRPRESDKLAKFMTGLSSELSTGGYKQTATFVRGFSAVAQFALPALVAAWYLYSGLYTTLYTIYRVAPKNLIKVAFGFCLCFFGGAFWASLAAIEAARQLGGARMWNELLVLGEELGRVKEANSADDRLDRDRDGVADVDQMGASELVKHKARVAMRAVEEPRRVQAAVTFLWSAWVSILMTLRFAFARYIAIALALVEMLRTPTARFVGPALGMLLGRDLLKWVPVIIESTLSLIAFLVVCYITSVIKAFYAALRGGEMFAEGLFGFLHGRGLLHKVKFLAEVVEKPDETWADEILGVSLAAAGFWYQLTAGFSLPFPVNIVLAPLSFVEWAIRLNVFQGRDGMLSPAPGM